MLASIELILRLKSFLLANQELYRQGNGHRTYSK